MIVHLDADAFFASVEQAASYEARKLGIYTPMPTVRALKLCPRLIIVRGHFEKTLKLRYNDFADVTRSVSLEEPADMEQEVYPLLPMLLRKAWERRVSIRMVALKLSHIYGCIFRTELSLDEQSRKRDNERRLAGVLDGLRENHSIMRGHDLWFKQRKKNEPRADTERCADNSREAIGEPGARLRAAEHQELLQLPRLRAFHPHDHRSGG